MMDELLKEWDALFLDEDEIVITPPERPPKNISPVSMTIGEPRHKDMDSLKFCAMDLLSNLKPFCELRKTMSNVTEDGGVQKLVMRSGEGEIPNDALVFLHYKSWIELSDQPFDSSYLKSDEPSWYQKNVGNFYIGFELCLGTMSLREKSHFLVAPQYAFGDLGIPPRIPPKATILLEIEVFRFVNCGGLINKGNLKESLEKKELDQVFKEAQAAHDLAYDYGFHRKTKKDTSWKKYFNRAIHLCEHCLASCAPDEKEKKKMYEIQALKSYKSFIICCIDRKCDLEMAAKMGSDAVTLCGKTAKVDPHMNCVLGKLHMCLGNYDEAKTYHKKAFRLAPTNAEINQLGADLCKRIEENQKRSAEFSRSAVGLGLQEIKPEPEKTPTEFEDEEFEKKMIEVLNAFLQAPATRLLIPYGASGPELNSINKLCCEMNIAFYHNVIDEKDRFLIEKR